MSEQLSLDFASIADPVPEWAASCRYCFPDAFGRYDEARHLANDLPMSCPVCRQTEPNRLLYEMNHGVNLGASWQHRALLCVSLSLRLNHLSSDMRTGEEPRERDLTAVALGWMIGPDGAQIAPEGWPSPPTFAEVYG